MAVHSQTRSSDLRPPLGKGTAILKSRHPRPSSQARSDNPIAAVLGPRQCGKTTLARSFVASDSANYFDLEDPVAAQLLSGPMTALSGLSGLVVIDEAQRQPDIFPILRVLADRENHPAKFLILGSYSHATQTSGNVR